jgi:acid phosphatase type 7
MPNSEVRISTWGVLKLDLRPGGYDWQFVAVNGIRDSGSGACR